MLVDFSVKLFLIIELLLSYKYKWGIVFYRVKDSEKNIVGKEKAKIFILQWIQQYII